MHIRHVSILSCGTKYDIQVIKIRFNLAHKTSRKTPFYYGWVILGAAGSTQIARNTAAALMLAIFMYPMANDLGWNRSTISAAASIGGIASSFVSPVVGWLIDKYGTRLVLTISILILGASTFLSGWVTTPIAFYLTYGIGRTLFNSPIQIGASVVVSRWFVKRRGKANGLLSFCHSIGMTGLPLLGAFMIGIYGWQTSWQILGIIVWTIALAPVFLLIAESPESIGILPDGQKDTAQQTDRSVENESSPIEHNWKLKNALKTPALWQLSLGLGLLFIVHSGINIHMASYYRDVGLSANQSASAVSLAAIFTGIGGILWGWVIDRIHPRFCYAALAIFMATASLSFVFINSLYGAWALASFFGISLGGILVVPPVITANYYGRESLGAIRGFIEPFGSFGQAIGALLSGIIFDVSGDYTAAFYVLATSAIIASLITITARQPKPL